MDPDFRLSDSKIGEKKGRILGSNPTKTELPQVNTDGNGFYVYSAPFYLGFYILAEGTRSCETNEENGPGRWREVCLSDFLNVTYQQKDQDGINRLGELHEGRVPGVGGFALFF